MTPAGWEVIAALALLLGAVGYLCRDVGRYPPSGDSKPKGDGSSGSGGA